LCIEELELVASTYYKSLKMFFSTVLNQLENIVEEDTSKKKTIKINLEQPSSYFCTKPLTKRFSLFYGSGFKLKN
jgi:hypothetical protein